MKPMLSDISTVKINEDFFILVSVQKNWYAKNWYALCFTLVDFYFLFGLLFQLKSI